MKVRYTWRKLSAARWEDAWIERLRGVSDRLAITSLAGSKTIRLEAFELTKSQAEGLRKMFGGVVGRQKQLRVLSEPVSNPIRVRNKLTVVGVESARAAELKRAPGRPVLWIPAGMAFGTGDHATTATCLRFLADVSATFAHQSWDMLDLGTGSGILALAGRLLGCKRALAGDFDPHAVRTAKENARLNGIRGITIQRLDVRTWHPGRTWSVVAANLFSDLLKEVAPKIAAAVASGGWLVFSGILCTQEEEVIAAFRRAGLKIERVARKGKWVSGLASKPVKTGRGKSR